MLIVEQNVRQVLDLVDRAYLLEAGQHPPPARPRRCCEDDIRKAYMGHVTIRKHRTDLRLLPPRIDRQRAPARRRAGAAGARPQPDLRRRRRRLDRLCRAGDDRHVRDLLAHVFYGWPLLARLRRGILLVGAARPRSCICSSSSRSSAPRRSTSCLPPAASCSSCRALRRFSSAPTSATSACACRSSRSATCISQLLAPPRLLHRAGRRGRPLAVPAQELPRHRHSRDRQDRDIMGLMGVDAAASTSSPRPSAAASPGSPPASWCCNTTCTRPSASPSGRSPS